MPRAKTPLEYEVTLACARMGKAALKAVTATAQSDHAAEAAAVARAEAANVIAATMPLLTGEQREQLRPLLAGTIPARTLRADSSAA